jgi:hypothetical protein
LDDAWDPEAPRPPVAELACRLARGRFWRDAERRLIATHPGWFGHGRDLDLPDELAHALVLVLSRLPETHRRGFADAYFAAERSGPTEIPPDEGLRLALAAGIALLVAEIVADLLGERLVDLLHGAAQGDDLTRTPAPALDELRKNVARIRFDVELEDPSDARGAAALAIAEVLDPSSEVVALQEVLARAAWAAVGTWEPRRVLRFLLDADRLVAEASG